MVKKQKSSMVLKQRERARARDEKVSGERSVDKDPTELRGETPRGDSDTTSSDDEKPDQVFRSDTKQSQTTLKAARHEKGEPSKPLLDEKHRHLWELRPSLGKGTGMFARKKITRGTRLLADECLIHLPEPKPLLIDIERAFDQLQPNQQAAYMGLHCPDRPGLSPVVRVWEANCFRMGKGGGICLKASRINHSCTPNAFFAWNVKIQRETVHAIVDIQADEEIFINYCHSHADVYSRQQKLTPYGFDCDCAPCLQNTASGRTSEARRCRMGELYEKIKDVQDDLRNIIARHWREDELQARLELVDLLEKERVFQLELRNQYHCVAMCYDNRRNKPKALEYAKKAAQTALLCVGPDSDIYEGDRQWIQELNEAEM
ncbi:MAG: hypothetical protein Q9195_000061 [Heterodermia aff. obscurata]